MIRTETGTTNRHIFGEFYPLLKVSLSILTIRQELTYCFVFLITSGFNIAFQFLCLYVITKLSLNPAITIFFYTKKSPCSQKLQRDCVMIKLNDFFSFLFYCLIGNSCVLINPRLNNIGINFNCFGDIINR